MSEKIQETVLNALGRLSDFSVEAFVDFYWSAIQAMDEDQRQVIADKIAELHGHEKAGKFIEAFSTISRKYGH